MDYKLFSKIIAGIVILASCVVMAGWFLDIAVLKSILPGWVTMKFITALSFFVSGILIFFIAFKEKNDISEIVTLTISFSLILLMTIFFLSFFFGISTGIESLFVKEQAGAVNTGIPGVPAIPTMLCFIFIGVAGLVYLSNYKNSWGFYILGTIIAILGALAVIGYLIKVPFMYYSFPGYTSMAFHTALLFVLIGLAFILIGKENAKQ